MCSYTIARDGIEIKKEKEKWKWKKKLWKSFKLNIRRLCTLHNTQQTQIVILIHIIWSERNTYST